MSFKNHKNKEQGVYPSDLWPQQVNSAVCQLVWSQVATVALSHKTCSISGSAAPSQTHSLFVIHPHPHSPNVCVTNPLLYIHAFDVDAPNFHSHLMKNG